MSEAVVLIGSEALEQLSAFENTPWGVLDLVRDPSSDLYVVRGVSRQHEVRVQAPIANHYTQGWSAEGQGLWYRVSEPMGARHAQALIRRAAIPAEELRSAVVNGWKDPGANAHLVMTWLRDKEFHFWLVTRESAEPVQAVELPVESTLDVLAGSWPVEKLQLRHVAVVGVGSIGSTAAESLARDGVGHLSLIDPDRLLPHNLLRHRLTRQDVGRYKVDAVGDSLESRFPWVKVDRLAIDAVAEADRVRSLVGECSVILCAADGVTPRRVVNHLARRAGVPAVFACVLEDGSYGELVRVRPTTGCLLCLRRTLVERGSFDPEPGLDLGYGEGLGEHRPMTATPGDLALMGELAAKCVIATLLEPLGYREQELPGDHSTVALRAQPSRPPPLDLEHDLQIWWGQLPPSRADCVTCSS